MMPVDLSRSLGQRKRGCSCLPLGYLKGINKGSQHLGRLPELTGLRNAGDDLLKCLSRRCFIWIIPCILVYKESEYHVLGTVLRVAELEHQVGNELV
jgi:hypothetical protein